MLSFFFGDFKLLQVGDAHTSDSFLGYLGHFVFHVEARIGHHLDHVHPCFGRASGFNWQGSIYYEVIDVALDVLGGVVDVSVFDTLTD